MVVLGKRANSIGESLTGRVLVLGKREVGKSAIIVRYTTGRYIGTYGSSTSDWLYRHWLGWDEKRRQSTTIELLEQKDIIFESGANLFNISKAQQQASSPIPSSQSNLSISSTNSANTNNSNNNTSTGNNNPAESKCWTLSWRVAMDLERDEKIDLLNRIQWAHAYVVVYAINDFESYEKAIRYLNLIAQTNYGSIYGHHSHQFPALQHARNNSTPSDSTTSSPAPLARPSSSGSNQPAHRYSLPKQSGNVQQLQNYCSSSSNVSSATTNGSNSSSANNLFVSRKPILLVANKSDLAPSGGRKVSFGEGRNLALRHQATFVELSVSKSQVEIEQALTRLFESIDSQCLVSSPQKNVQNSNNYINNNLIACEQEIRLAMNQKSSKQQNQFQAKTNKYNRLVQAARDTCSLSDSLNNYNDSLSDFDPNSEANDVFLQLHGSDHFESEFIEPPPQMENPPDISINSCLGYYNNKQNALTNNSLRARMNANCVNIKPPAGQARTNQSSGGSGGQSRYKNLKSSFKRASMAIVSSRTLLNSHNNNNNNHNSTSNNYISIIGNNMSTSSNSINLTHQLNSGNNNNNNNNNCNGNKQSSLEITLGQQQSTKWHGAIKQAKAVSNGNLTSEDEISIKINQTQTKSNASTKTNSKESLKDSSSSYYTGLVSERLKRSIFKYKTRRKTVAFEPSACKSRVEQTSASIDGDIDVLFINRKVVDNAAPTTHANGKRSAESSTNSLTSSNAATQANNYVINPGKQQANKQINGASARIAPNLDRSRSALNKGDKLYYRSIFGIQRPLSSKQQQSLLLGSNELSAKASKISTESHRAASSSSSSTVTSGQSSPISTSNSPTPAKAVIIKETIVEPNCIGSKCTAFAEQHLATQTALHQDATTVNLVSAVAVSEPLFIASKKQSTVRSVMNTLTRRPTTTKPATAHSAKKGHKTAVALSDAKKPIYAGLFGSSTLVSAPVIFKQTIEPVKFDVARAEPLGKMGKCAGLMMRAGFCQQL